MGRYQAEEAQEIRVARDTTAVLRTEHGHFRASACTVSLCGCGHMWIGGNDTKNREFVQLPITPVVARQIAADLLRCADMAEAQHMPHSHKH